MQTCYPYFIIKREQAEIALQLRMTFTGARDSRNRFHVSAEMDAIRATLLTSLREQKKKIITLEPEQNGKAEGNYVQ